MNVPRLRAPIVLVHGLLGYDRIAVAGWTLASYFPGIPEMLEAAGNVVRTARLSPTGGIAARAAQLKTFLDRELPNEAVHIMAHSMGGLDARYMISRLGMADRVLTLTTIGTPHRGSPFADWSIHRLERVFKPVFGYLDIPARAFYDLTTLNCREFNCQVPDVPQVRYFSVAGRCERRLFSLPWQILHQIVHQAEGPNDGVVSVVSASYGEDTQVWEADHLGLVNWSSNVLRTVAPAMDRRPSYAALVRRLADEGF
jgi:triacylglycerol lipase